MPRNGTGTFNAPGGTWNPPVNGVTATAADWAALLADLSTALTQSLAVDGQAPATGNLPMGGNKLTGLANGSAATDSLAYGQVSLNVGECRLAKSGANLLLSPFNGNRLTINGVIYTIPAAGVTLAATSATPNTTYNIYAYMVGATMTLEYSTTAHATDSATGVEIKSGDATRTLVGMARAITGPAWADTGIQRFVLSWFNRRALGMSASFGSTVTITSTSYVELSTGTRNEFLCWASDEVKMAAQGGVNNTTIASFTYTSIGFDGTTAVDAFNVFQAPGASYFGAMHVSISTTLTEGYHYATTLGRVSANTGGWAGSGTAGDRNVLIGTVLG